MPASRRNAKSSSFKHHPHASDDRHSCDMPTQPQVISPKHIPMPDFPTPSDLYFEIDAMALCVFAMFGQYINLYRSVYWLPYSHNEYALNYYLIDYSVLTINLIVVGRRLPVCILKQICALCFPSSYHSTCSFCVQILTMVVITPVLLFCSYNVIMDHGFLSILFLIYPFGMYFIVNGTNAYKFLELKTLEPERGPVMKNKNLSSGKNSPSLSHVCSMSAESIREEVEVLRNDCNNRWRQVLFNSFLVMYHTTFLPCYFTQSELQFDLPWVTQHGVLTTVGCFNLYIVHLFPPKYCDVLHRAALHLGRWQRVEIKNVHVPYSTWTESAMWNQGALVKHTKELFKAEGISNAAEPGHSGHSKFYTIFKNPSSPARLVWILHLILLSLEMFLLFESVTWNDLVSIQLLILINCKTLYTVTKVYFVVKKIYYEEKILISKISN